MSDAQWQQTFERYQLTPEYQLVNKGMGLEEFKLIFWWEYWHRLLGRLIGVAFLLPFLWFLVRRDIPPSHAWKYLAIFVLGGLQGVMGWYMVKSGLVDDPRVSQFRLTAHLGLAIAIFWAMFWVALSLVAPRRAAPSQPALRKWANGTVVLIFVMILSGGFVAGIRAGFAYNTFPLMNGHVVPPEILMLEPAWTNFFWNMATVQFDHRMIAWTLAIVTPLLWRRVRRTAGAAPRARADADALLVMLALQIGLGIATLINVVPLPLAAAHQAGALIVFGLAVNLAHALRAPHPFPLSRHAGAAEPGPALISRHGRAPRA